MNSFDTIKIRGARENNLRNISLDIPKYKITIFTGVSGSGKSSLVMDTIAAKSRRELNDTFPTFVQQYLPKYGRPKVDSIEGLPIAIVIDQKKPAQNSRSTVGTYTDIYALLRLLFSRVGKPFVGYSDSFSFRQEPQRRGHHPLHRLRQGRLALDPLRAQRPVRPRQEDQGLLARRTGPLPQQPADPPQKPAFELAQDR